MEEGPIAPERLIVVGGSAGSLEALLEILALVKASVSTPIILVLHRKQSNDTVLSELLSTKTQLQVREIEDKEVICKGTIYVAPGDYHVLFEKDGTMSLDDSEKVNYSRPSIDVAFQSAADAYGEKLSCILLSGANADGTEGFKHVKECGGVTIAQQPESAEVDFMPKNAINNNVADHIFDNAQIAAYINVS